MSIDSIIFELLIHKATSTIKWSYIIKILNIPQDNKFDYNKLINNNTKIYNLFLKNIKEFI